MNADQAYQTTTDPLPTPLHDWRTRLIAEAASRSTPTVPVEYDPTDDIVEEIRWSEPDDEAGIDPEIDRWLDEQDGAA